MTAPTVTRPATDKQIAFLTKLIDSTGMECEISPELTTKEASALIDQAIDLQKTQRAAKATKPTKSATTPEPARDTRVVADLSITELLTLALEKAQHIGV